MCGTKINEGVRATSAVIYESVINALILLNVANKLIKKGHSITVLTAVLDYFDGEVELLLDDHREYDRMVKAVNPYGDGRASEKILSHIKSYFLDSTLDSK